MRWKNTNYRQFLLKSSRTCTLNLIVGLSNRNTCCKSVLVHFNYFLYSNITRQIWSTLHHINIFQSNKESFTDAHIFKQEDATHTVVYLVRTKKLTLIGCSERWTTLCEFDVFFFHFSFARMAHKATLKQCSYSLIHTYWRIYAEATPSHQVKQQQSCKQR